MSSQHAARLGSQEPTHLVVPAGSANPRLVDVVDLAALAGLHLDEWQQLCLDGATMLRPDGRWAAFEVCPIVPRQNGKGSILEARQIAGLFLFGERLQIHTAHEFKTCFEHFRRVKELVEGCPSLSKQVKIIRTGAGDQAIEHKNGNRIRFLARSRTSGLGFSADVVYLDEAFELYERVIGALMPTMSARPNPQIWYTSSAPHVDSEVLHRLRRRAMDGEGDRLFFAEWSNDPGVDPTDREAWYRANPGLGIRITEDFVANEQASMSPAEFARERLGIPEGLEGGSSVLPVEAWNRLSADSTFVGTPCVAVDIPPERTSASIALAGWRADGLGHVEVTRRDGTSWLVDHLEAIWRSQNVPIVLDNAGPAGSLVAELEARRVKVDVVSLGDYAKACGALVDAVSNERLRHRGQVELADAVAGCKERQVGDVWVWSRSSSRVDISPLVAVTLAWGRLPRPTPQVWARRR